MEQLTCVGHIDLGSKPETECVGMTTPRAAARTAWQSRQIRMIRAAGVSDRGTPKVGAPWQKLSFERRGGRFASKGASFTAHFHEFSLIRLFLSVS